MKTLIASYCEPDNPSLNWQLHAFFASYLALESDQIDFLVTIPTGTEHFLDPQIPYRIRDPIHADLRHPRLESVGLGRGYVYANHFLAVEDLQERYDHILLTDVDTLVLPRFKTFAPPDFLVGRGGYSTDYNYDRLRQFAEKRGFKKFGRYRNIGPTWYGVADVVVQCAQQAKELVHPLLYEEDWTETSWPEWWIGVRTYA